MWLISFKITEQIVPYMSSVPLYMCNCKYSRVPVFQPKCCYESQNTVIVFSCTTCVQHVLAAIIIANYAVYLLCSNWTQSMSKCHDTSVVMSSVCVLRICQLPWYNMSENYELQVK